MNDLCYLKLSSEEMGVFISLKLSDTITKKEWTPVYENKKLMTYKPSEMFKFLAEDTPENT